MHLLQAIQTKYLAPTNTRGTRIKATCAAGSLYFPYDYSLNPENNHFEAAKALATKLQWKGELQGGVLANGTHVWVYGDRSK